MKGIPRDVIIADTGKQYTLCVCGPAPLFTSLCRVVKAGDVTLLLLREDNLVSQGDARSSGAHKYFIYFIPNWLLDWPARTRLYSDELFDILLIHSFTNIGEGWFEKKAEN